MDGNGKQYALHWIAWNNPPELEDLELAIVTEQEENKRVGEVTIIRTFKADQVKFHVELVGEEEFARRSTRKSANKRAKYLYEKYKKVLPPSIRYVVNANDGAYLTFPLLPDLNKIRNEVESVEQLTAYLLPHITRIMNDYFAAHEFHCTIIK